MILTSTNSVFRLTMPNGEVMDITPHIPCSPQRKIPSRILKMSIRRRKIESMKFIKRVVVEEINKNCTLTEKGYLASDLIEVVEETMKSFLPPMKYKLDIKKVTA